MFPTSLVSTVDKLFFKTRINISINGWLGAPVNKLRGLLRQGDPLSPLLFNLTFESFLRSILACQTIRGISLSSVDIPARFKPSPPTLHFDSTVGLVPDFFSDSMSTSPPPLKILSYADDFEVFLNNTEESYILLSILKSSILNEADC